MSAKVGQTLNGPFVKCTGGNDVDSFGGENDQLPFRQRLHRPVDHVSWVLGSRHIQNKRCHEQADF